MGIRNFFYIFLGVVLGSSLSVVINSVYALTIDERANVITEQNFALKYTGRYQPVYGENLSVFTYEKLCKGYYTVENNGTQIKYTGFGDLADEYTFTYDYPVVDILKATSTNSTNETETIVSSDTIIDFSTSTELSY